MFFAADFYNQNSLRRYPLDDTATGLSDAGALLPNDLLLDCRLIFPRTYGNYVFLSSASASARLLSATFVATAAVDTVDDFVPLGHATVVKDGSDSYRVRIEPLIDGVSGWVVFGTPSRTAFSGRFATPAQSLLLPRVCRSYRQPSVTGIGVFNRTLLRQLVSLDGGTDVEVLSAIREIDGSDRAAIVLRLKDRVGTNVLDVYRGPCSGRAESNTCSKPPIESINEVRPDCDGNIEIVFTTTCAKLGTQDNVGAVLDYCLDLAYACTHVDRLPQDGRLPNEYDDQCAISETTEEESETEDETDEDELPSSCAELPWLVNLLTYVPDEIVVQNGEFAGVVGEGLYADSGIQINLAAIIQCNYESVIGHSLAVFGKLIAGSAADNLGIAFGNLASGTYWIAEIDKRRDMCVLRWFANGGSIDVRTYGPIGASYADLFRISVAVSDAGAGISEVTCQYHKNGSLQTTFDVSTNIATASQFGFSAVQCRALFTSFLLS